MNSEKGPDVKNENIPVKSENGAEGGGKIIFYKIISLLAIFGILFYGYISLKPPTLELIEKSLARQSTSFLLVSTLKSSLSMVEGSTIGVGLHLEIGDIVQSTYDLVDFTWKILLYGMLIGTFCKIIVESGIIDLGTALLLAGFLLMIAGLLASRYREKLHSSGKRVVLIGLIISFFVPITTIISFHSCDFFVRHIERDLDGQLNHILSDWESFKKDVSLKKVKESIRSAGAFLKELSLKLTRILIEYTCLIIIKYFFFPIIIACGFYVVLKATLTKSLDTKPLGFMQSTLLKKLI